MKQVKLVQHPSDELDITALFGNILLFFSRYGKLLLAVAFTGLLAGALRYWYAPRLYSSALVVKPVLLSDPEQMELINNWAILLKKKELPVLAKQFGMAASVLDKLKSIETEELQKSISPNNYTAFTLTVLVTDTAILQPLQQGMVHAFDNSEYIKEKLAARKTVLRAMLQTVQQELARLYQLQTTVENGLQKNDNSGARFMLSVSDISSQIANLQEKKLNYEESLSFTSAVYILQNFYTPSKPTHPQLIKQLALGLAGGLLLGFGIACFLYLRRKLRQA